MTWFRTIIIVCAVVEAGWMAFDGTQALFTGHLVTPKSGPHAGELGPWRYIVQQAGIDPAGTTMQGLFSAYGLVWLLMVTGFAIRRQWGWRAMVAAAIGALWFIPFGTLLGVIQLALLFAFRERLCASK